MHQELAIISSDNGSSLARQQAIILTNDGILLIWALGNNFNEIFINIYIFIQENAFENVIRK